MGQTYLAEPDADGDEARSLRLLQTATIAYRTAFWTWNIIVRINQRTATIDPRNGAT